jgi:hypothetical protein
MALPIHIQKSRFDSPLRTRAIYHNRGAEAKHDGDEVRRSQRPTGCPSAKALGRDFSSVGIADGGCASG